MDASELKELKRLLYEMDLHYILRIEGVVTDKILKDLQLNRLTVKLIQFNYLHDCFFSQVSGVYIGDLHTSKIKIKPSDFVWGLSKVKSATQERMELIKQLTE
mgnify:CR=1 FL=1